LGFSVKLPQIHSECDLFACVKLGQLSACRLRLQLRSLLV
jgi:hypothetical protein